MPSGTSLVGRKYGHAHVLKETAEDIYLCKCDLCGKKFTAWRSSLVKGVLRDCGCTWSRRGRQSPYYAHRRFYIGRDKRRHQKTTGELLSWMSMRGRCLYKTTTGYENWGGRGIEICSRWLEPEGVGFANFLHDLGNRPVGMTLDRINPNGHYEPGNCRWAQSDVQVGNQRRFLWPGGEGEPPVVPMDLEAEFACG
jgi:hypothetical protein